MRTLLIAGLYPILLAILTGAAWLDGVYARALRSSYRPEELAPVFSRISDAMVLPAMLALLAGLAAAVVMRGKARLLCVASLGVLCLEFLVPAFVPVLPDMLATSAGGLLLRVVILLGALTFALLSLRATFR